MYFQTGPSWDAILSDGTSNHPNNVYNTGLVYGAFECHFSPVHYVTLSSIHPLWHVLPAILSLFLVILSIDNARIQTPSDVYSHLTGDFYFVKAGNLMLQLGLTDCP